MTEDGEYGAEDEPITSDGSFDDDNMTEDGEYGTEDEPIASDEPFDESDDICSNSKTVVTFPLELCDRSISGNDLEIPLYDGSQTTLLQAVIKNLCWFCEHPSISKEALSDSLQAQHDILPPGNCLPVSYKAVHKLIRPYSIPRIEFHACRNDCLIFRGEYAEAERCPVCSEKRFIRPGVPAKRFHHLPVGPRLQRLFQTANLAQIVQSHTQRDCHGVMKDLHDSPAWKKGFSHNGIFGGDPRGIAFSLCTDGLNPYSQNRVSYSMWPIELTILNLPRKVRYLFSNILLVGIVPGNGSKEPNSHP